MAETHPLPGLRTTASSFVAVILILNAAASATPFSAPPIKRDTLIGGKTVTVTVTLPASTVPASPRPVVFMFNGWMLDSGNYVQYAHALAGAEYVAVQYHVHGSIEIPDEVQLLRGLHEWLQLQNTSGPEVPQLIGRLILSRLAVVGHSRGGELAAFHFAGKSGLPVEAAYLIDPVDLKCQSESSSCQDLQNAGKPVAITRAGVVFWCNPPYSNSHAFWTHAPDGSWLMDVPDSGHITLAKLTSWFDGWKDTICWPGRITHEDAIAWAIKPMLEWFRLKFPVEHGNSDVVCGSSFCDWLKDAVEANQVTLQAKNQQCCCPICQPKGSISSLVNAA